MKIMAGIFGAVMAVICCIGCGTLKEWTSRDNPSAEGTVAPEMAKADHEAALRQMLNEHINKVGTEANPVNARIVKRKPYYFKEYSAYPDGPSKFEYVIQKTESRTTPYVVDVQLNKVRYATKFHPKRESARADNQYVRDTGTETLTFEWRGDAWVKVSSLFEADRTEEFVDGEWRPLTPKAVSREIAEDDTGGWFSRTWRAMTGR